MGLRPSISQEELRDSVPPEALAPHGTDYQASRGGHYPTQDRPVPGTPKDER